MSKRPYKNHLHAEDLHFLETVSQKDIRTAQAKQKAWLTHHSDYYSFLATQRAQIIDELKDAIRTKATSSFKIEKWCRVVMYKWALEPLSAKGSLLSIGGRFNVGNGIDPIRFPVFSALYLADNNETAITEVFGVSQHQELSNLDLALANADSFGLVRIDGELESVIDLRDAKNIKPFFDLIKNFKLPKDLMARAKAIGIPPPRVVKNSKELWNTLLEVDWRWNPMQCDIPSNSQIFGQIAESAGLSGIIYPSVKGKGNCLAVFVRNFQSESSWLGLVDTPPHEKVICKLDSKTCLSLM